MFAIERNGQLVKQLVFSGDASNNLYRDTSISHLTFTTMKAANEVAEVLEATVVDYQLYLSQQLAA
jgi:hypothetical protein